MFACTGRLVLAPAWVPVFREAVFSPPLTDSDGLPYSVEVFVDLATRPGFDLLDGALVSMVERDVGGLSLVAPFARFPSVDLKV
jgi:hypothetical protein